MVLLNFHKMEVCGNDFVICDWSEVVPLASSGWPELAREVCARRTGVGADELVILLRSPRDAFALCVINPDGSEAPTCGNAILAAARIWQRSRGLAEGCALAVESVAGTRQVRMLQDGWCEVVLGAEVNGALELVEEWRRLVLRAVRVNTGTPHAVVIVEELEAFPVAEVGAALEYWTAPGSTTNVMFVQPLGAGQALMRCWERGGTGETYACGSGACAAACAMRYLGLDSSTSYRIRCRGGELCVDVEGALVRLRGKPRSVCRGNYLSAAEQRIVREV